MKKYLNFRVLTTNLLLVFAITAFCQNPSHYGDLSYGPDSATQEKCGYELSNMAEFMKINLTGYALNPWRYVYANCPGSSKNIYISGVKIFKDLYDNASDESLKEKYYDTIMMLYDKRIEYFGEESYVLGRKGMDIIRMKEQDFEKAYYAFKKSAQAGKSETDLNVLSGLMQTGAVMFKAKKIGDFEFLKNYMDVSTIIKEKELQGERLSKTKRVSSLADKIIEEASFSDCNVIEKLFSEEIEKDAENKVVLSRAADLLNKFDCINSEFYLEVNKTLFHLTSESAHAYEVAKYYLRQEEYAKSAEYYLYAINNEEVIDQKTNYLYQLALIYYTKLESYKDASVLLKEAIKLKPNWGEPYLLLASVYVKGIRDCEADGFELKAINWLAVDYCRKAKVLDPSVSEKADELIDQYSKSYPSVEDSFFRSLQKGDLYTVECWINETTTVK
jgi:tetratricopeptide (TPR) repeat protein